MAFQNPSPAARFGRTPFLYFRSLGVKKYHSFFPYCGYCSVNYPKYVILVLLNMVSKIKSKLKIVHVKHEKEKEKEEENFLYEYNFFIVPNSEYHLFTISKHKSIIVMQKKGVQKQWEFKETNLYQKVDA